MVCHRGGAGGMIMKGSRDDGKGQLSEQGIFQCAEIVIFSAKQKIGCE